MVVSSNILSSQGLLVVNPWKHHSQPRSPGGESMEAPLEGTLPIHYHGQLHHHVTSTVKRADNAVHSFRDSSSNDSAHLAEIATDITLSELNINQNKDERHDEVRGTKAVTPHVMVPLFGVTGVRCKYFQYTVIRAVMWNNTNWHTRVPCESSYTALWVLWDNVYLCTCVHSK